MIPTHIDVLLASASPRRQELLSNMGIVFSIVKHRADETFPPELPPSEVAEYIANQKADSLSESLRQNQLLIASDTVVCLDDTILGKPNNEEEATAMLRRLSEKSHLVYTGVSLRLNNRSLSFTEETTVYLNAMTEGEINRYVRSAEPYDKAGGYAIQEWVGIAKIERIEGSYTNVVGLPTAQLHKTIKTFVDELNEMS